MRYRKAYLAVIGYCDFEYEETQKAVIQKGKHSFFICEASSEEKESFGQFIKRIDGNRAHFDGAQLTYSSGGKKYELEFTGDFRINDQIINTQYKRFNSPYAQTKREPETIQFQHNGRSLFLNYNSMIRQIDVNSDN